MKNGLLGASIRVRNKRLQQSEWYYLEFLLYFKTSIMIFFISSIAVAIFYLFSWMSMMICRDVELITAIPVLIFGALTLVSKWRMAQVSHQLPW